MSAEEGEVDTSRASSEEDEESVSQSNSGAEDEDASSQSDDSSSDQVAGDGDQNQNLSTPDAGSIVRDTSIENVPDVGPTEPSDSAVAPSTESEPIQSALPSVVPVDAPSVTELVAQLPPEKLPDLDHISALASVAAAAPVASRESILRSTLEKRPRDGHAHLELISLLKANKDNDGVRSAYDDVLKAFPLCATQWIEAIKFEFSQNDTRRAEALFARSLRTVLSIELWHLYLDYVRKTNILTLGDDSARKTVGKAYEFVLNHLGMDRNSGQIWSEYIAFLKSADARGNAEEEAKVEALRKVYRRALVLPLNNIEQIWRDYDQFENALSKANAKKYLAELSPSYMTARTAMRELRPLADALPKPPIPLHASLTNQDGSRWIELMQWEQKNPLELDEIEGVHQRVMFAAKQAFIWAYLTPTVWYHVASYLLKEHKEDAKQILIDGFNANPESLLLGFALAEYYENVKAMTDAYTIYHRMGDEIIKLIQAETESGAAPIANGLSKTTTALQESLSLITIHHLHAARRGESIKAARQVFSKARKSPQVTWHVFESSAMMEYHNSKEPAVATKVFELGMSKFSQEPAYIERYLRFLLSINDVVNARALFERSLTEMGNEKSMPLWDIYMSYECNHGDLATIQTLDSRFLKSFPDAVQKDLFVRKHKYSTLEKIAETAFLGYLPGASTVLPKEEDGSVLMPQKRASSVEPAAREFSPVPPPRVARDADTVPPLSLPHAPPNKKARQNQGRNGLSPSNSSQRQSSPATRAMKPQPLPLPAVTRPPHSDIPEAVMFFLSILPNIRSFNGPALRVDDIMELFRTLAPFPAQGRPYGR